MSLIVLIQQQVLLNGLLQKIKSNSLDITKEKA